MSLLCDKKTVTILAGETISTVLDKIAFKYLCIFLPSNWVTSAITFQGCDTIDGTFNTIIKASDASIITIASIAASKVVILDTDVIEAMVAIPYIKLVSTQTQTSTDKIITITLKR